ncbi:7-deoxyloganetic acid glucosyl transferase-like [Impatiens glandulifera]|uniref:7-deoxyloganetic acid glucosyl transferase-like n=1 Tax=Impatiens glandulifera TaxID=253017 RepID=UPI001FB16530|nr:7-deoxyloganetic acid glucosyl transferase-like [Impatiens glandulifera]
MKAIEEETDTEMEQKESRLSPPPPHVLIFPLPLQGPVNSLLKLAELLCIGGLHVTFLVTDHINRRNSKIHSHFSRYPGFYLDTISDGLPEDHPRTADTFMEIFDSLENTTKPLFKEMLRRKSTDDYEHVRPPVNCVIGDGILGFTIEVARELGIPIICTRTISPCFLWLVFCLPKLFEAGELPFDDDDLDVPIKSVPGMEGFLRRRDLPSFCRAGDLTDPNLRLYLSEINLSPRADGLILNSFEELEGPLLSHIRTLCPNLYTIGPLHAHLNYKLSTETSSRSSNFRDEEDRSCLSWLNAQPEKSVIYVSFGSIVVLTIEQMTEFRQGLVNSGHRFLWVIRDDAITGGGGGGWLREEKSSRGYIVGWAPQEEVLSHPSVGGFLTHSGWNSTLESIYEGKPMLCWPYFVDQQLNSRFVGEVWKLGLDMKDTRDRFQVEKMVREIMSDKFNRCSDQMARLARQSIEEDGSSSRDLNRLIQDIKAMTINHN